MLRASLIDCLRVLLWAGVLAGAALLALSIQAAESAPRLTTVQTLREALVAPGDSGSFPDSVPQAVQALPDDWAVSRPGFEGAVWYRVHFDAPPLADPDAVLALYVERACTNLEVHLNGHRLYRAGRMQEPVTRNCYQPQLVALPAALLNAQGNTLDLELRGHALEHVASRQRAAGLSTLRIGPMAALAPVWRVQQFWNVTAPQMLGVETQRSVHVAHAVRSGIWITCAPARKRSR